MSDFNYQEYLRNNPLLKEEVKEEKLLTESQEVTEEETLNEGIFDKVKEKVLKVADKIKNKFSADEIAKMKDAVKKALGKDKLELSDITLDNVKKVVNVMKDQLAEGQLEESLGDKIKKALAGTGMLGGLAAAIVGGSIGTLSAPLVIGGLIAMIIGGIISANLDEEITEKEAPSSKMTVSELKAKIKEDIISLLQEEEEDEVEVEDEIEDEVDVEMDDEISTDTPSPSMDAGLSKDEQDIQDSLKVAYDKAVAIGDEKLADQIGNSITFFTRSHVVER
jgi:membrane-associated HD superfamily phosphohydrolase